MKFQATTSQTVGPFYALGLRWLCCESFVEDDVPGERIVVSGKVVDGEGQPVPDALLEIWQASAEGKYAHQDDPQKKLAVRGFSGFGRVQTNEDGSFRFATIKPGRVPGPDGKLQAPHLAVSVFCRGLLRRLVTRAYFSNEASNAEDFALSLVEAGRRHTLIAQRSGQQSSYEWNVVLQGSDETVFFDIGM
jgi:protocatechuate 3,4-dioxygenase, alpha subunit